MSERAPDNGMAGCLGIAGFALACSAVFVASNRDGEHDSQLRALNVRVDEINARVIELEQWQAANTVAIEEPEAAK